MLVCLKCLQNVDSISEHRVYRGASVVYRGASVVYRGASVVYRGASVVYRGASVVYRGASAVSTCCIQRQVGLAQRFLCGHDAMHCVIMPSVCKSQTNAHIHVGPTHAHACTHACMHACMHARTHARTHAHTHTLFSSITVIKEHHGQLVNVRIKLLLRNRG